MAARALAVAAVRRGRSPARPRSASTRARAVVGGRPARSGGGAARRRRTPEGRVPRGRGRRGRAAPRRHRARGADRDGARARGGRADRRGGARARGARPRSGRSRSLARRARADDRRRRSDYALARVVAAARAFGLQAVDGPHARLGDDLGLVLSARRALEHGYDGKWVIHPSQIEPVNRVFTPSPAELERARRILEAAAGAARFEGELVDEASRRLAECLLRRAELLPSGLPPFASRCEHTAVPEVKTVQPTRRGASSAITCTPRRPTTSRR